MSGNDLPFVNAVLNATSTVLLLLGFLAIKTGRVQLHKSIMLSALAVSAIFLSSYLFYHFVVRQGHETKYTGEWRIAYLVVLISHVGLAPIATILALYTATLGLRGKFARHRKIARWTFPIWLYVSVTGVVVYLFLKDFYPQNG